MRTLKFGGRFAHHLRRSRRASTGRWHLDEMVVKIGRRGMYLWRAVDDEGEGEVLDMQVQKRRNKAAALRVFGKLLKKPAHPLRGRRDRQARLLSRGGQGPGAGGATPAWRDAGEQSGGRPHLPIRRRERKQQSSRSPRPRGFSPPTPPSTMSSTSSAV